MTDLATAMSQFAAGLRRVVPDEDQWAMFQADYGTETEPCPTIIVQFTRELEGGRKLMWEQWVAPQMLTDSIFNVGRYGEWVGQHWFELAGRN